MALLTVDFHTKSLARRTRMDVFIPSLNLSGCLRNQDASYYQNNKETYPLIIFLHGFGDNEKAWQMNTQVLKLCEDNKIAACFINGENKWYLEKEVAAHSSVLFWEVLWTEEPGGLQFMGLQRGGHD